MWVNFPSFHEETVGHWSAGQHDESDRSSGGVEPVGASSDEPDLGVDRLCTCVGQSATKACQDPLAVDVHRCGELGEGPKPRVMRLIS